MPLNAPVAVPDQIEVAPVPPQNVPQAVPATLPTAVPTELAVSATRMTATVAAGVKLAKMVLAITAASILLFFFYLLFMDLTIGENVQEAYRRASAPNRAGTEFHALNQFERAITDLAEARKNPAFKPDPDAEANLAGIVGLVIQMPSIPDTQKTLLRNCVPLPTDNTRDSKLTACSGIIEKVRAAVLETLVNASTTQMASDLAGKINEHRQSLHNFWIQAVQIILVNVLLPLLTALFGYIFGTQQSQRQS